MACTVCNGRGTLLGELCPLCGNAPSPEQEAARHVFHAEYLSVDLSDDLESTFIEVAPPPTLATRNNHEVFDLFVILDCSYSMQGLRIQRANDALQALYTCKKIHSMTVFQFGTAVRPPQCFCKSEQSELPLFEANCGTTHFIPPLCALDQYLNQRVEMTRAESASLGVVGECLAIFLSDGECQDAPNQHAEQLGQTLHKLACPLLSVAITTAVSPDVMVLLSDLNGDLPLLLINDDDRDVELTEQLLEHLPLNGEHEIAHVSFSSSETDEVLEKHTRRFLSQGPPMSFISPSSIRFQRVVMSMSIATSGQVEPAELRLSCICEHQASSVEECIDQWGKYGRACLAMAHSIMGAFIKGEFDREIAEKRVLVLREAFHTKVGSAQVDDKAWVKSQLGVDSAEAELTCNQRRHAASLIQARRAALTEFQQGFNKILDTIGRNDLKSALEAYSRIGVSVKKNRRLNQIALANAKKTRQSVDQKTALRILNSCEADGTQRDMASCLLWLCNPYEALNTFDSVDQGDWVGRGVLVVPGPVAALNCWRLEQVLVRPFSITLSLISQIQVTPSDGQRLALIQGVGYPEINACLPMITVGEHVGAVRLAIHMMRHSTAGQESISDIICGSRELFAPPMVNAIYVNAFLTSLARASLEADYEGALSGLLTCMDLANLDTCGYWAGLLQNLIGENALSAIANKDMDSMPDVIRAFLAVVCTDVAYSLSEEQVKLLFARLLVRSVLDQTSQKLQLFDALGVEEGKYFKKCVEQLRATSEDELECMQTNGYLKICPDKGSCTNFHLHSSKLSLMYSLHMVLRKYMRDKSVLDIFHDAVGGRLPSDELISLLKEAQSGIGIAKFVASIFEEEASTVVHDLLVCCCSGQIGATKGDDLPKHDGRYVAARLQEMEAAGLHPAGLGELARTVERNGLAAVQRRAFQKVHYDRHKLQIVHRFAHAAIRFLEEHPWESHRHHMPYLTLGFTTDQRRFASRDALWACLEEGWYHREDLEELLLLSRETVVEFNFEEWKASHRHFLPGFHLYSVKNIAQSRNDCDRFVGLMEVDMERHYNGTNGSRYRRPFTPKMRSWVQPYARHIWQEALIAKEVQNLCSAARSLPEASQVDQELLVDEVWQRFPELSTLQASRSGARRRHIRVLVDEALDR